MSSLPGSNNMETEEPRSTGSGAWQFAFGAHIVLIGTVSLLAYSGKLPLMLREVPDELGHFTLIGLLALLAHRAFDRPMVSFAGRAVPFAPVVIGELAAIEEMLQVLSPNRGLQVSDFIADIAGIAVFYAVDRLVLNRRHAR